LVFIHDPIWLRSFLVEVQTQDLDRTIAAVGQIWNTQFPQYPFEYHFLDSLFDRLYRSERVQLQLLSFFSLLSILIAGVGLFSLVAFHLQTRLKEIAIRKVLGANVGSLIRLVSREYFWMVLVGGILAIPLSYWAVQRWLDNFAYRVAISPFWYCFALLGLLGILLGIISWQTWRSSRVDPTNLLRGD
ncbi:MAG: FtsX-like permease family protein, partial [Phaeodactylibacter sp.]|nr:FtsX-like permease family protein [Phaeodactylibacter sp.]